MNPVITSDQGIVTVQAIAEDRDYYRVYPIRLDDGDEVAVTGEIARGILLIRDALTNENRERMNRMTLLELLHIYDQAVSDGLLNPSSLRLYAEKVKQRNGTEDK